MSTCRNPKLQWIAGFKKMAVGDILPGSPDCHVTYEMFERLKAGVCGDEQGSLVRSGHYLRLDCGSCSSCIFKAVMAKTGAMLNESQYSGDVAFLTMTYRPDVPGGKSRADMADKVLHPPHIRTLRERMRRDSHYGKFRSLIVGEYGDLRGRAHWHVILWSEDGESLPEFPHDERFQWKHWPHGHCFARPNPGQEAFQYVAGYCLSSLLRADLGPRGGPSQLYMTASRRPVLGYRIFAELGARAAEFDVPPSFNYLPPGGDRKYNYTMKDRARDLYIDAYLERLAEVRPNDPTFSALSLPLTKAPQGTAFRGVDMNGGPDVWMHKAIMQGLIRRRDRLNPVDPVETAKQDMAEFQEVLHERQVVQERINAIQAERRHAAAVKAALERSQRFAESFRDDPSDPYWEAVDAGRYAADVVRSGSWRDF